ncbi:MAG: TIGR02757 family protein [Candidatus Eisenbacteria bacterium]|nr:TIGR02757 family protein [Candidatus Eisenbacteria bacterium]
MTSESSRSRDDVQGPAFDRETLDRIYERYNTREYTHPDPVELIYRYDDVGDREVAALVAALLSLGRVRQILGSARDALARLGPRPGSFLDQADRGRLEGTFEGFRHRFTTGCDMAATLHGAAAVRREYGTLGARLAGLVSQSDETVVPGLEALVDEMERVAGRGACGRLLPLPSRRSACKRLHLFLRWMVRRDDVDPGGFDGVSPAKLVVPLDTHMHRIALAFGLTRRRSTDVRTALEITEAFRRICPEDPVRYDFALTRSGIHPDVEMDAMLAPACTARG